MDRHFLHDGPVAETLFLPMASRIYVSKRFPDYFYDKKALELEPMMPQGMNRGSFEYSHLASVSRYRNIDRMAAEFTARAGDCNVVSLGAGLDTFFDRLSASGGTGRARFFAVDLPEVSALRRKLLGSGSGEEVIAGDMFDLRWAEAMDPSLPTLITAVGVFQYFTRDRIIAFIRDLQARFPHGRLLFEATSRKGLKFCNWFVERTGNKEAQMSFYVDDGMDFARRAGAVLIEERPGFTEALKILGKRAGLITRLCMRAADAGRAMVFLYLDLNG